MAICYFDDYVRADGEWLFSRRREKHWYAVDLHKGQPGAPFEAWRGEPAPSLPSDFPTWRGFWSILPPDELAKITHEPISG